MNDRSRPKAAPGTTAKKSTHSVTREDDVHGAELAADARPWFNRLAWDQAIAREIRAGREFAADDLQERHGLPSLGNGCGGVFRQARREGRIRCIGYRPSRRPSRAGGIVAIWTAGDGR